MLVYVLQPPLSGCQHYLQFVQLDMIFWALYEFNPIVNLLISRVVSIMLLSSLNKFRIVHQH